MTSPARKSPQIAPRKRPSQARSERTVELLLEAAARVLQERGLEGYTTNAVAERSGVSVGSLYQYFPNKDALMSALVLQAHLRTAHHLGDLQARLVGWPLPAAMEEMVRPAVVEARRAPRLLRVIEFEEERLPRSAELEAAEDTIHRNLKALLVPYLAHTVSDEQATEAAHHMIGLVQGMIDRAAQQAAGDEPLEAAVARAVIGYLAPLLARHPSDLH